tara:strand:- start:1342 stop:5292 length:3951 start_codon:yes stop_codon:yes gene_type:complete
MATNTATSFTDHTGNNTAGPFNISFNYLDQNEVDVIVDGELKTINSHYTFTTASTISFTNGNFPAQNAKIRFQRDTNISAKKVDFSDGSVLTESDLDLQNNQLLYGLQESIDTITHDYFQLDGSKCLTGNICFEGATTDDNETHFGVTDPTADQTYLLPNLGAGTYTIHTSGSPDIITNTHIASGTIIDDNVSEDADIKGTKIEPEFGYQVIRQRVSGYGMELWPDCQIKFGVVGGNASTMQIGPDTAGNYDGNMDEFIDNNINLGHPNLGRPWSNEINSLNGHRATILIGRLTMAARKQNHTPHTTGYLLRADGRDGCMFYSPDNSLFGDYYGIPGGYTSYSTSAGDDINKTVTENMDIARDAADFRIINGGAKANNKLEIGSSTTTGTLSLSGKDITSIIINSAAVAHTANDASVFTTSGSDARYFRQDTSETITSGITWSGDDAHVATTGAIDARIIDLIDDVGGFVPIANETSFPNANPDVNNGAGTLLSVPLANNITSNGSGVISIANGTIDNSTVTINGAANNTTYSTGFGIIVETTSTLNTYTFHRYVPKATEVTTVAGIASNVTTVGGISANVTTVAGISSNVTTVADAITNVNNVGGSITSVNNCATNLTSINNFGDKYQVAGSNPSTDGGGNALAVGDLYFDTTNNLLKVYNGTAWQGGITATEDLLLKSGDQMTGNLTFSGNQTVDGRDVSVDGTKLDGIAANANNYSISSDLLDEDNMATNSATKVASQQSIKAYVDTANALKASLSGANFTGDVTFTADGSNPSITIQGNGPNFIAFNDTTNNSTNLRLIHRCTPDTLGIEIDDGTKLFQADSDGRIQIPTDTGKLTIGEGNDLQLYHSSNNSFIKNNTGILYIDSEARIRNSGGTETIAKFIPNGAVELYYDNNKKFETDADGATISGDLHVLDTVGNTLKLETHVNNGNDSTLVFQKSRGGASGQTIVQDDDDLGTIAFKGWDGSQYRNAADIIAEVDNTPGAGDMPGRITFRTSSDDGSTLSKRLQLLSDGKVRIPNDSGVLTFGLGDDLQIYHDGSQSFIKNNTGILYIDSQVRIRNSGGTEAIAKFIPDGAVELYYDNSKKFETTSTGVLIDGSDTSGSAVRGDFRFKSAGSNTTKVIWDASADEIRWNDSYKATFGTDGDLEIYHNGNHSLIRDTGTGNLKLTGTQVDITNSGNSAFVAQFIESGAVKLYYDGTKKMESTSSGITVTGTVNETSDISLKNNINTIQNPLDLIKQIRGINFTWSTNGMKSMGVIAQDVEKVFPELVHGKEGSKTLQYSGLIGALIESVKELTTKIEVLKTEVAALKGA